MKELLEQFEKDLKIHLEYTFNSITETDIVKKLDQTEKTVFDFVDNYLLQSSLIAKDVEKATQRIVDQFMKANLNASNTNQLS